MVGLSICKLHHRFKNSRKGKDHAQRSESQNKKCFCLVHFFLFITFYYTLTEQIMDTKVLRILNIPLNVQIETIVNELNNKLALKVIWLSFKKMCCWVRFKWIMQDGSTIP